jgi:four helix bundle protein
MTRDIPREETHGLASQIWRFADSVPGNIAEGQGRISIGEFRQFLDVAVARTLSCRLRLNLPRRLGLGDAKLVNEADELSHEVGKMIYAIRDKIGV